MTEGLDGEDVECGGEVGVFELGCEEGGGHAH